MDDFSDLNHRRKMAHKLNGTPKKALADRDKDILNDNVSTSGKENHNHNEGCESESEENKVPECAVCLQTCIHPVKLPCNHIFCFLCVKGVANQSKRCALCRHEIPMDFLNNPALLRRQDLMKDTGFADGFQWYYEGRNGWWQYDERTSTELEDRLKRSVKAFEILIAGFLYVIDLDAMVQIRRNDPTRRRRIKRDLSTIPKKGVAGLKTTDDECEEDEDGVGEETTTTAVRVAGEGGDTDADGGGGGDGGGVAHHRRVVALGTPHHHHHHPTTTTTTGSHHSSPLHHGHHQHLHPQSAVPSVLGDNHHQVLLNTMSNLSVSLPTGGSPQHAVGVGYAGSPRRSPSRAAPGSGSRPTSREHSPSPLNQPPVNTPQSPENPSEAGTPDSVTEEMNRNMEELALTPSGRYRHMNRHGRRRNRNRNSRHFDANGRPRIHLLDTSSSSSDSDWDYWY